MTMWNMLVHGVCADGRDDAFARLPAGTLETLLKPENQAKLKRILTYHVMLHSAKAVSGDTIAIATHGAAASRSTTRTL
jgi:uncharacterized surface protein with fasciclin (FAS1) repeats